MHNNDLRVNHYYYPHFTDKETEAQCYSFQSRDLNLDFSISVFSPTDYQLTSVFALKNLQ